MNLYFEYKIKEEKLPKVKDIQKLFKDFISGRLKALNIELNKVSAAIEVQGKQALIAFNVNTEEPPEEIAGYYKDFIEYAEPKMKLGSLGRSIPFKAFPDVD